MGKPVDVVQGTVDLLIMKAVALEPVHGWAIAQRINQLSQDVLRVNQGFALPRAPAARARGVDHR